MQKIIDSLIKETSSLYTPMNIPLCIEIRQGQFSWHLEPERTTCVSQGEVFGSGEDDPNGEFGIFFAEINGNY